MIYRNATDSFFHRWLEQNLDVGDERYSVFDLAQALREDAAVEGISPQELERSLGATVEEAIIVILNARHILPEPDE